MPRTMKPKLLAARLTAQIRRSGKVYITYIIGLSLWVFMAAGCSNCSRSSGAVSPVGSAVGILAQDAGGQAISATGDAGDVAASASWVLSVGSPLEVERDAGSSSMLSVWSLASPSQTVTSVPLAKYLRLEGRPSPVNPSELRVRLMRDDAVIPSVDELITKGHQFRYEMALAEPLYPSQTYLLVIDAQVGGTVWLPGLSSSAAEEVRWELHTIAGPTPGAVTTPETPALKTAKKSARSSRGSPKRQSSKSRRKQGR